MIIIRILFAVATFFVLSFVTVLIAKVLCGRNSKELGEKFRTVCWFVSTVVASVFVTLWCILREIV